MTAPGADPWEEHGTQLLEDAEKAVRMAAAVREHLNAGRLLDAWAAADWLSDLAAGIRSSLTRSKPVRDWREEMRH